jgi:Fe-S oxidoreductase
MLTLIMVFIRWFQVDDSSWHFSSLFGYYATGVLLYVTSEMILSRLRKKETIHRYSHTSDWLFLVLLFATTLTGIMMHLARIAGWPMGTYVIYVIHLAIAVPMLVIEVPFGKWAHLFYRPLAVFLATVKEKALNPSVVDFPAIKNEIGETFTTCMHCGTCTTVCPSTEVVDYSPRLLLRHIALDRATSVSVDDASWNCTTCNSCTEHCPRGIGFMDIIKFIHQRVIDANLLPRVFDKPIDSLKREGNPWGGKRVDRLDWAGDTSLPAYDKSKEYCLFNCCTITYDNSPSRGSEKAGIALLQLLNYAQVSYGTLGVKENCCGDMVDKIGAADVAEDLEQKNTKMFLDEGVTKILTVSPHCLNTFSKNYEGLRDVEKTHYSEILATLIETDAIRPVNEINARVTYHDPCYLGRHNGIYDAPRQVLQSIPGLEFVEMKSNRDRSFCCGGGGGGLCKDDSGKGSLGKIRIQEALDTGASILATACPYCIQMLNEAIEKMKVTHKIQVRDISEILLEAVDLKNV